MKLKYPMLASLILAPSIAFSAVTVKVPNGIQVLTVNEKDSGYSSFGFDSKSDIQLEDGVNQIVFRISKIVMETGSEKTKYKSQPLVATFEGKDAVLSFDVPNIKTLYEGSMFNDNPTFDINVSSGEVVNVNKGQLGLTFSLAADMVKEIENYNQTDLPASLKNYRNPTLLVNEKTTDHYDSLKTTFKSASLEDRKKFLTWAISNLDD